MQRYYDVLGLQKGVSPEELKKTYRELSKKYHPDAHHNSPLRDLAEAKFKEINEAYEKIKEFLDNNFSNGEYIRLGIFISNAELNLIGQKNIHTTQMRIVIRYLYTCSPFCS